MNSSAQGIPVSDLLTLQLKSIWLSFKYLCILHLHVIWKIFTEAAKTHLQSLSFKGWVQILELPCSKKHPLYCKNWFQATETFAMVNLWALRVPQHPSLHWQSNIVPPSEINQQCFSWLDNTAKLNMEYTDSLFLISRVYHD